MVWESQCINENVLRYFIFTWENSVYTGRYFEKKKNQIFKKILWKCYKPQNSLAISNQTDIILKNWENSHSFFGLAQL